MIENSGKSWLSENVAEDFKDFYIIIGEIEDDLKKLIDPWSDSRKRSTVRYHLNSQIRNSKSKFVDLVKKLETVEGLAYGVLKLNQYLSKIKEITYDTGNFKEIEESLQNIRRLESRFLNLDLSVLDSIGMQEVFFVLTENRKSLLPEAYGYLYLAQDAYKNMDVGGVLSNCRSIGQLLDQTVREKFGEGSFTYNERWKRIYGNGKGGFNHWLSMPLHKEDIKKEGSGDRRYDESEVKVSRADNDAYLLSTMVLIRFVEDLLKETKKEEEK